VGFRGNQQPGQGAGGGQGRSGWSGGGGDAGGQTERRGGGRGGFDPARMLERFKSMIPDEQRQFIARMKDRGQDTTAFEQAMKANTDAKAAPSTATPIRPKYGAPASGQTIDALFAPLPTVESRGRAWLFMNKALKPVNLRLGISDGTNTELLSTELQQGMEVVTGVTGLGTTRTVPTGNQGNPLMPGGRGPGGGFGGPGGRGGGR